MTKVIGPRSPLRPFTLDGRYRKCLAFRDATGQRWYRLGPAATAAPDAVYPLPDTGLRPVRLKRVPA